MSSGHPYLDGVVKNSVFLLDPGLSAHVYSKYRFCFRPRPSAGPKINIVYLRIVWTDHNQFNDAKRYQYQRLHKVVWGMVKLPSFLAHIISCKAGIDNPCIPVVVWDQTVQKQTLKKKNS